MAVLIAVLYEVYSTIDDIVNKIPKVPVNKVPHRVKRLPGDGVRPIIPAREQGAKHTDDFDLYEYDIFFHYNEGSGI